MAEKNNNIPVIQGIDIMELVAKLWKNRSMIIKWCVVGAVIGLVVGFSVPKTYTASVTLAPETEQRVGSGVSSIASMMGVSLDNSVDAISVEMFPDVVASTPFIYDLLDLPVTFERRDSVINTSLHDYLLHYQKVPWWSHIIYAPFKLLGWAMTLGREEEPTVPFSELDPQNLPKDMRSVVKYLSESISIMIDKKTGKTRISLTLQDRHVVAKVVETIYNNLTEYITAYRTSKVRQDVENLTMIFEQRKKDYYDSQQVYADFLDGNKNIATSRVLAEQQRLQQEMNLAYQVYSQVATQLEAARIKVQEAKPVFAVLEPVSIPIRRTAPSKLKLLVVFTFLAGFFCAGWLLFGEDYWKKFKETLKS